MWFSVVMMLLAFVITIFIYLRKKKGDLVEIIILGIALVLFVSLSLTNAWETGLRASKIVGEGSYYEVVVTATIPSKGTIVYAIDLDGNKEKTEVLAEYPIKGYKIEQIGKRTFLLPIGTRVALDKDGVDVFISEKGEAFNVPRSLLQ